MENINSIIYILILLIFIFYNKKEYFKSERFKSEFFQNIKVWLIIIAIIFCIVKII